MKKYWHFFKIGFQVAAIYPVNIIFRVFRHATIVILFIFLWSALISKGESFNGFNIESLITYYILAEIVDVFYTQTPARMFNRDLKNGDLNNFLTKPIDYWKYLLSYTFGQQLAACSLSILAVVAVFVFFPQYLTLPKSLYSFGFFLVTCGLGFLLSHQLLFVTGLLGFWVSETAHIRQGVNQLMGLLGGHWVPLVFFPTMFLKFVEFLPFKYLFNFPVQVFTNQISSAQIHKSILIELYWLSLFLFVGRIVWKTGIKKYEAYGQ